MATAERWKDRNGEWQSKSDWHNVVVWNEYAQKNCELLSKGSKVHVEGKLKTRKYTDRDGNDKWMTEVVVENFGGSVDPIQVPDRRDDDRRGSYRDNRRDDRRQGGFGRNGGGRYDDDRRQGSFRKNERDAGSNHTVDDDGFVHTKPPNQQDTGLNRELDDDIPF